uniref:MACPF domain-containing protein n=1 Tax=Ciona intestinalis TaxID=7719 RepID=H2XP60_CIOIN
MFNYCFYILLLLLLKVSDNSRNNILQAAKETRDCMPPCATDCEWNFWSKYGKCGCKSKEQLRHRTVKQPSLFGGKSCDGAEEDSIPCKEPSKQCKNKKKKCGKKKFACKAGTSCIKNALVCNGDADCVDSSDELKCKKVKLTCGKETYPLIPNIQIVGGAFDITTLARSSEVLDNSLFNGVCNNVYSPDHKKHFRKPYNVASFSYQVNQTHFLHYSIFNCHQNPLTAKRACRNMQTARQSVSIYTFIKMTQMSQLVGHAAGGDNAKLEKMIKDGYSDDYKYFSVKTVITVAMFQMRDDNLLLNEDFEEDLNELHSWYDKVEYLRLLEKYGTHYYTEGTLGGQYKFIYKFRKADLVKADLTDTEQRQCLEDDAKIKLLGADVDINDRCNFNSKSFTNNAVQSVSFVDGGEANAVSSLSVNSDEKSLTEWTNSVIMHPAIVEYKIAPLSQLIDSRIIQGKKKKANMETALLHFMKKFEPIRCNSFNAGKVVKDGRECVCLCPAGLYGAGCE